MKVKGTRKIRVTVKLDENEALLLRAALDDVAERRAEYENLASMRLRDFAVELAEQVHSTVYARAEGGLR